MEVERDKNQRHPNNEWKTNTVYKSHAVAEETEKGIQTRNKEQNVELQREFKSV